MCCGSTILADFANPGDSVPSGLARSRLSNTKAWAGKAGDGMAFRSNVEYAVVGPMLATTRRVPLGSTSVGAAVVADEPDDEPPAVDPATTGAVVGVPAAVVWAELLLSSLPQATAI